MASFDEELRALREKWAPSWKVWRARRTLHPPGVHDGEFVATRMDEEAGPERTVMRATPEALDAALREQRDMAGRGVAPLPIEYLE